MRCSAVVFHPPEGRSLSLGWEREEVIALSITDLIRCSLRPGIRPRGENAIAVSVSGIG